MISPCNWFSGMLSLTQCCSSNCNTTKCHSSHFILCTAAIIDLDELFILMFFFVFFDGWNKFFFELFYTELQCYRMLIFVSLCSTSQMSWRRAYIKTTTVTVMYPRSWNKTTWMNRQGTLQWRGQYWYRSCSSHHTLTHFSFFFYISAF